MARLNSLLRNYYRSHNYLLHLIIRPCQALHGDAPVVDRRSMSAVKFSVAVKQHSLPETSASTINLVKQAPATTCESDATSVAGRTEGSVNDGAPTDGRYSGREMPSFFIFQHNVDRFIPRRAAAPFGPPTTQRVSRRAPRM